ncbi:MAG: hypothetical protein ACI9CO_001578 [Candidatus Azotimanducaceae bacterium]|jgi:hypothetical protein
MSDGSMSFRMIGADQKDRKIRFLHEHYLSGDGTGENLIRIMVKKSVGSCVAVWN